MKREKLDILADNPFYTKRLSNRSRAKVEHSINKHSFSHCGYCYLRLATYSRLQIPKPFTMVTVHGPKNAKIKAIMWSLDFIRRKNHDQQGARGKKWRFFHNFATFVRERLLTMRRLGRLEARTTRGAHTLGYAKTTLTMALQHGRERLPIFFHCFGSVPDAVFFNKLPLRKTLSRAGG